MSKEIHTFVIEWENHTPTQFVSDSLRQIESEVSNFLKNDRDFVHFINALADDPELEPEDKKFLKGLLNKEHTITMDQIDRVGDIDVDDYKFQQGRIRGWGHSVHLTSSDGNVKFPGGMNQFKAKAKHLQLVLKKSGLTATNAQCLEMLSESLFNKPFGETRNTLI